MRHPTGSTLAFHGRQEMIGILPRFQLRRSRPSMLILCRAVCVRKRFPRKPSVDRKQNPFKHSKPMIYKPPVVLFSAAVCVAAKLEVS